MTWPLVIIRVGVSSLGNPVLSLCGVERHWRGAASGRLVFSSHPSFGLSVFFLGGEALSSLQKRILRSFLIHARRAIGAGAR